VKESLNYSIDSRSGLLTVALFSFADSAASAVRNLNDYEIMNRKLRVDFSNETVGDDDNRDGGNAVRYFSCVFNKRHLLTFQPGRQL
jgi:hypothetical protein